MNEFIQIEEQFDGSWALCHLKWDASYGDYIIVDVLEAGFSDYDSAREVADSFAWLEVRDV